MKDIITKEFGKVYGDANGVKTYFAPGRVNLIGEHTDYNGGHVFPCALTIGTYAFYDCGQLTSLSFPSGATVNKKAYGFGRTGAISGAKMYVYDSSNAHVYAETNSISYELLDESFPLEPGVTNNISFDENTLDKANTFTFNPS